MPSMYLAPDSPIIYPIASQDDWEAVDYPIVPSPYKKQAGRPKMKRDKEPSKNKQPLAPNTTRMPKTGIKMTCQLCKWQGNNRVGCPITKAAKSSQAQVVRPFYNVEFWSEFFILVWCLCMYSL